MKIAVLLWIALASAFAQPPPKPGPPQVVYKVDPEYTPEAKWSRIEGDVEVHVTIDAKGSPSSLKVVRSLGYGLDAKALEAVSRWRWRPQFTRDRKPTVGERTVTVEFRLPKSQ